MQKRILLLVCSAALTFTPIANAQEEKADVCPAVSAIQAASFTEVSLFEGHWVAQQPNGNYGTKFTWQVGFSGTFTANDEAAARAHFVAGLKDIQLYLGPIINKMGSSPTSCWYTTPNTDIVGIAYSPPLNPNL